MTTQPRGVPALDPVLNRAFAELVLVAEADRDVNRRPHSNAVVLGYARAARRYATARAWPEAAGALYELALLDGGETALRFKVRACARALLGQGRVRAIELEGATVTTMLEMVLQDSSARAALTAVPAQTTVNAAAGS